MTFDAKPFLKKLPHLPGIYRMIGETADVLYVGKAKDLKNRVSSYFSSHQLSPRIAKMVSQIADIQITITRSEAEALLLEDNLIKTLSPKYNILFRDDKTYPYLIFSDDEFPRIAFFRGKPATRYFFGPYPGSSAIRETMLVLQKIFQIRTCENTVYANRSRPCLLHQISRCTAPCVDLIDHNAYQKDVYAAIALLNGKQDTLMKTLEHDMQEASDDLAFEKAAHYRDQIIALQSLREKQYVSLENDADVDIIAMASNGLKFCVNLAMIRGGRHRGDKAFFPKNAQGSTSEEVLEAFIFQHYADNPIPPVLIIAGASPDTGTLSEWLSGQAHTKVRILQKVSTERKAWQDMALKNAQNQLARKQSREEIQAMRLAALAEVLGLPCLPERIECFDISHTMGEETMGACVVFDQLSMQKKDYRRFNIRANTGGDDYAAMAETIERRYSRLNKEEAVLPHLILIDGGLGQVSIAYTLLSELRLDNICVIGVAKGPERQAGHERLVFPDGRKELYLGPEHPAILLVNEIRDEAHRFALMGHRMKRDRKRAGSILDEIDDIGPKRRQRLLARFGGLQGIRGAGVDDLASVDGISLKLAEKIYTHLH